MFYVDEIIIADRNLTVFQADSGAVHPGGNLVESLSVEGSPPVYNVTIWSLGCSQELPLITASPVPTEGAEEGAGVIQVRTQRLQRISPPLGGDFCIRLSNKVIPGVPAHISAHNLQELLQNNVDDFTSRYLNASDFTVTEDRKSCYEHVWTLSWSTQIGDLPEFISNCSQCFLKVGALGEDQSSRLQETFLTTPLRLLLQVFHVISEMCPRERLFAPPGLQEVM